MGWLTYHEAKKWGVQQCISMSATPQSELDRIEIGPRAHYSFNVSWTDLTRRF